MNKAMQLTQNVVGQMLRGARFAKQKNGHVGVTSACGFNEFTQIEDCLTLHTVFVDLFVVNRHHKGRGARRLVGHHAYVDVSESSDDLHILLFERLGQRTNAQSRGGFGTPIFVDDDDREAKFHSGKRLRLNKSGL